MEVIEEDELYREFAELDQRYPQTDSLTDLGIGTITGIVYFEPKLTDLMTVALALHPTHQTQQSLPLLERQPGKFVVDLAKLTTNEDQIISVSFQGLLKGYDLRPNSKRWPHALSLHLVHEKANISVKISATNIHICGLRGEGHFQRFTAYFLDLLKEARQDYYCSLTLTDLSEELARNQFSLNCQEAFTQRPLELLEWLTALQACEYDWPVSEVLGSRIVMMKSCFMLPYCISLEELADYLTKIPGFRLTSNYLPDISPKIRVEKIHYLDGSYQSEMFVISATMKVNQTSYSEAQLRRTRGQLLAIIEEMLSCDNSYDI